MVLFSMDYPPHMTQDHVQLSATAVDIGQALTEPLLVQWEGAIWEQICRHRVSIVIHSRQ